MARVALAPPSAPKPRKPRKGLPRTPSDDPNSPMAVRLPPRAPVLAVTYSIGRAALYALHIARASGQRATGAALPGSPFALRVQPSAADPSSVVLTAGWAEVVAGTET
eukprot:7385989-Prymnesium_polylepis.1